MLDRFDGGTLAYGSLTVFGEDEDGKAVYDEDAVQEARMKFGIVFQNFNLFPHRTVMQNIIDAPMIVQKREEEEAERQRVAAEKRENSFWNKAFKRIKNFGEDIVKEEE